MDFSKILEEKRKGKAYNPYAAKINNEWQAGLIDIKFLNDNFGSYSTATEMKNNTQSEGLQKYFDYLADQGKIPQ